MVKVLTGNFGKAARLNRVKRSSMCQHGHHRWLTDKTSKFDVKQGKLLTIYRCAKCDKTKAMLE